MHAQRRSSLRWLRFVFWASGWLAALAVWLFVPEEKAPPAPESPNPVAEAFAELRRDPALAGTATAFCLLDEEGRVVFASPNAATAMTPASALKTLTTGAALALLGPEFCFETKLIATGGRNHGGELDGDLVLVGGGDPTLAAADLEALAAEAAAGGLRRIRGPIRVDATVFPKNPVNDHWNWGDLGNAYGVGAFGLNVGHNRMVARFRPGMAVGEPAAWLGASPDADFQWVNEVTTGPRGSGDGVVVYSEPYGRRVTFRGTVPLGEENFPVRAAVPDPPALAVKMLREALIREGIEIAGETGGGTAGERVLAVHRSAPLLEIVEHLHRVSDNLEAQCLFLMIGRTTGEDPATAVRRYWELRGVEFKALRLLDGSGLARANKIRALDLAEANRLAREGPTGDAFFASLSPAGDGIRSKIGGMSGVRTEVGFLRTESGRELTFALMANALPSGVGVARHRDALLNAARQLGPKP